MGNYASCAAAGSKVVRVVLPGGEVRTLKEPVSAAELMLETPNSFVVNTRSLHIGRRFPTLNAEEELCLGGVYALFPMKRLNSVICAADLGGIFLAAKKKSKARVAPEMNVDQEVASTAGKMKLEELCLPEFGHRRPMCRAKKPALGTIVEEPIWVR